MDLTKSAKLLLTLREKKGLTQKQVADYLGVLPKTVSKWECGHGFPDVSNIRRLADILGVSADTILKGEIMKNADEAGNMKKLKFYVCKSCGSFMQGIGDALPTCCGETLTPLSPKKAEGEHGISISEVEDDLYITFSHEMAKTHYISFVAAVGYDRVLTVKLYPEQDSAVRIPMLRRGHLFFYCTNHGLFEYSI